MIISISEQARLFLVSVQLGIILSIIFDFFRAYRKFKKFSNKIVYIQDFIYIVIITVIAFYIYLYESNGAIRFYYFIGISLGSIIYFYSISKYTVLSFIKIISTFDKAIKKFIKIMMIPVKWIYKIIRPYIKRLLWKSFKGFKKYKKYYNKPKKYLQRKKKNFKRAIKVILEKV